jgi:tetratricopeptide (TPR) repeat protein
MGDLISDLQQIRRESENGQVTQTAESLTVDVIRAEAASKGNRSNLRGSRLGLVLAATALVAVAALSVWSFRSRRLPPAPDLKSGQSAKSEAYEDYMRGMVNVNSENPADNQAAIKRFEQAIAADRNFAPAYAELSRAYTIKARYVASATEREQTYVDAEVRVGRALALDPNLAEGHFARGLMLWTPYKRFLSRRFSRTIARSS